MGYKFEKRGVQTWSSLMWMFPLACAITEGQKDMFFKALGGGRPGEMIREDQGQDCLSHGEDLGQHPADDILTFVEQVPCAGAVSVLCSCPPTESCQQCVVLVPHHF